MCGRHCGSISLRSGFAWSRLDKIGSATPQSAPIVGIVPRNTELVGRVVVRVDEVRDRHVGERGEPVRHAGRDEDAPVVVRAIGVVPQVERERAAVRRRSIAQVVQHHPGAPVDDVPVVGLVEVIVEPHDGAGLAVAPVALDHLAAVRKPLAAVGLDEDPALVAVHRRVHDVDASDDAGLGDRRHALTCWRRSAGRSR